METEPFFRRYTRLVTETDLVATLETQRDEVILPWLDLDDQQTQVLHAPYSWTIREVIGHMIDTEIIFTYRALRFARGDTTPLRGFEEGQYVIESECRSRSTKDLVEHMTAVRNASILLFASLPQAAWSRAGEASGLTWTVTDLCQATIGHVRHHARIIAQRLSSG